MALLFGSGLPFAEQSAFAAEEERELDLPEIELPDKGNPKLDSQLNRLVSAATTRRSFSAAQESSIEAAGDSVRVIVECLPDQIDAAFQTANASGIVETSYGNLLQVMAPVSQLAALADTPGIRLVRMPLEPVPDVVTSEGVALINADDWQSASYNGTGVKVAILDGGFTGHSSLLGTELPASVITQSFYAGSDIEGSSAHGTACAEIVYDVAPAAQLYLVNFGTTVELGNAVDWLISQGVDIISASWGYPIGGPGDGTGPICDIVNTARSNGILWVKSMGNSAQMHWQGDFVDTDSDGANEFSQDPFDEANNIIVSPGQSVGVALKWDDTWGSSGNDYDLGLYRYEDGWIKLTESTNEQNGSGEPWEYLSYTAAHDENYYILIFKYGSPDVVNFHLYSYNHIIQHQTASSSFSVPADSSNAMAVGAVFWNNPSTLESFSSRGPTKDNRVKPDLVAPDGVSTASYGASNGVEYLSGGAGFFGTSASAPHVAGAAVLVKQRYPSYTPAQIQSFLEGRAVDLGDSGKDNLYGSGRLDLGSPPALTPPTVTTSAASNITTNSAILNGNLGSLGEYSSANVSFEWGTTSGALDQETTPEAMTSTSNFSANLTSLSPSTTYYFQAKAAANATAHGSELSFTTSKVLVSANVTPDTPTIALGRSQQFTATGNYTDNSTANITDSVTWGSSNTTVATINASGLAQSLAEGQTLITATSGNVSANTTLTVGPKVLDIIDISPEAPTVAAGRTQQFTATGNYSDNSTANITGSVAWASSSTTVATINASGLAQSLAEGQTTIIANLSGVSGNTTLTVSAKVLDVIAVTPANPSIDAGRTQQFTANGTYSDASTANLTTFVTWASSNTTVAMVNTAGLARSYAEGTTVITAYITASSGNISDNATLTVGPAVLDAVIVTPVNPTIGFVSGNPPTLQFIATADYSNGATANVTSTANWTSDNDSVADIGLNTGLATTVASGNTTISANFSGTTGNTTLIVLPDTVAPVVTLTSPTEGQVLSSNTTTVSGTVDDLGATANVTINGGTPIALTLGSSGNFSQSASLNTGSNTILVTAVDDIGNTGTSGTVTVVVNPNKPGITITQPPARTSTDNSSLTVTGTVSGNVSSANLILNGVAQPVNVIGGNFSANVTLTEGVNVIAVNAYINGHEGDSDYRGTSGVRMVTLDTTPPVVTIATPVSGSVVSKPGCVVSGSVDDPGVSTANLTLNGASQSIPVVSGSFRQNVTLVSGNNTVTVTASDA
ncbi:Ig-like domain-containing protein, partial [Chloroflexota bacterium]